MQSTINQKVKFRESFRPFAPSVLAEEADEYFDLPVKSPYMLLTAQVRNKYRRQISDEDQKQTGLGKLKVIRSDIPAVTHVDYSARIQTVSRTDNPRYHALISRFKEKTGYGLVVNTSFNRRGEPIVRSPEDACQCFMQTGLDMLVLEDIILYKNEQPEMRTDKGKLKLKKQKRLTIE